MQPQKPSRKRLHTSSLATFYALVWAQCKSMLTKRTPLSQNGHRSLKKNGETAIWFARSEPFQHQTHVDPLKRGKLLIRLASSAPCRQETRALHRNVLTHEQFDTTTSLHKHFYTHYFHIHFLLQIHSLQFSHVFTHRCLYTQEFYRQVLLCTRELLHTETLPENLYRHVLSHTHTEFLNADASGTSRTRESQCLFQAETVEAHFVRNKIYRHELGVRKNSRIGLPRTKPNSNYSTTLKDWHGFGARKVHRAQTESQPAWRHSGHSHHHHHQHHSHHYCHPINININNVFSPNVCYWLVWGPPPLPIKQFEYTE